MNWEVKGDENIGKILRCREFVAMKEDRMIFMTDGVVQSGLGEKRFPLGWGLENVAEFAKNQIEKMPEISATKLSRKIINQATMNDSFDLKDDTSCGVIYFREPRNFMLITGPPFYKIKDYDFVTQIKEFNGGKSDLWWNNGRNNCQRTQPENFPIKILHRWNYSARCISRRFQTGNRRFVNHGKSGRNT